MGIPIDFNITVSSPPPTPNLSKLRRYISELVVLARSVLNSEHSHPPAGTVDNMGEYFYLRIHINDLFVRSLGFDFYAAGAYYDIVEACLLLGMVRRGLSQTLEAVRWPEMDVPERERQRVWRRANDAVQFGVFDRGWSWGSGAEDAEADVVHEAAMGALEEPEDQVPTR
jgi:hypothetical protein